MAKERPVPAGGKSANPRGRHPAAPPAPGPRRPAATAPANSAPADSAPADPAPIPPPFLAHPEAPDQAAPAAAAEESQQQVQTQEAPARGRASAPPAALERAGTPRNPNRVQASAPVSPAHKPMPPAGPAHKPMQRGVAKVPAAAPMLPGLQLQPVVHVGDMAAAVTFYEALGGAIIHGDRDSAWVLMQVGTNQISLVSRPPDPAHGESTVELNFSATMPLHRLQQLLAERNITIIKVAVDVEVGTRLHVETPDGMPIKIHHVEPDLLV